MPSERPGGKQLCPLRGEQGETPSTKTKTKIWEFPRKSESSTTKKTPQESALTTCEPDKDKNPWRRQLSKFIVNT